MSPTPTHPRDETWNSKIQFSKIWNYLKVNIADTMNKRFNCKGEINILAEEDLVDPLTEKSSFFRAIYKIF